MKNLLVILLFIISSSSFSQKNDANDVWENSPPAFNAFHTDGKGGKLEYSKEPLINFETYVFADTLFVRKTPNLNGAVQDTLLVGDDVKIIDGGEIFKIGNRQFPWFKISYSNHNNTKQTGYAWGGLISFKALRRGNTKFVYGIPKVIFKGNPADNVSESVVQLKAVENRKTIAKTDMTINTESTRLSNAMVMNNNGLTNVSSVLSVSFSGEACAIPSYYFYLLWDGKKFYQAPKSEAISDAGVYSQGYYLIFPSNKGGIKNKVIQNYTLEQIVDEEKDKWKRTNSKTVYSWTGSEFVKD
jgi:Bacterial SH3 domain